MQRPAVSTSRTGGSSAGRNRERSEPGECGSESVKKRVASLQFEGQPTPGPNQETGHRQVPVAQALGPKIAVGAEPAEQLGPPAKVQRGGHDRQPRPVGHELVLAEHRQPEVLLELPNSGLHEGLVPVLGLKRPSVGAVIEAGAARGGALRGLHQRLRDGQRRGPRLVSAASGKEVAADQSRSLVILVGGLNKLRPTGVEEVLGEGRAEGVVRWECPASLRHRVVRSPGSEDHQEHGDSPQVRPKRANTSPAEPLAVWRPTSDFMPWGGEDSNLRPADYEFVPAASATCSVAPKTTSDQRFLFLMFPTVS